MTKTEKIANIFMEQGYEVLTEFGEISKAFNTEGRKVFTFDIDSMKYDMIESQYAETKESNIALQLEYFKGELKFTVPMVCMAGTESVDDWFRRADELRAVRLEKGSQIALFFGSRNDSQRFMLRAHVRVICVTDGVPYLSIH